jgi:hypothetical protein
MKQVYNEEKDWMKAKNVVQCNPPKYDEISVENLYDSCVKMPNMAKYFPDSYAKGLKCNQMYFFSILAALHPEYYEKLIRSCKDQRFGVNMEEQKLEAITISERWADELK